MREVLYLAGYHKRLFALAVAAALLAVLLPSTPAYAAPVVILTPDTGAVGTRVTVTGTVFESYKGDDVYIFYDDIEIDNSPIEIPDAGTFTTDFVIPADSEPGRHWVRVRSEVGSTSFLAENFLIVEGTEIELDVADGVVNTNVNVSGKGFYAGRTVTIYYYNAIAEKMGTVVASATGGFSYLFTVPNSTAGEHRIVVSNAEGNSAEGTFEVIPSISLNLPSGGPGELLYMVGTGFGYKSEVSIYFGIHPVASAETGPNGNFDIEFNIPDITPDLYDVKAEDELGNVDKIKFNMTAGASLNTDTGHVGSIVTIEGSGFEPGGTVDIIYDNTPASSTTTDNYGAFTAYVIVPPSSSGSHVITASDGETTRQLTFRVEAEPPPAPRLLLPAEGTDASARVNLDWQDVTDSSLPVAYSLQLASDPNFSSMVLEAEGIYVSEYSLSEKEQLAAASQRTPYYWRVKATDSAGNESEWSLSQSFYVCAPPAPSLVLPAFDSQADMPIFFNWGGVISLNPPVTYTLQVATDESFANVRLQKQGLQDSEYTMTEEEELPTVKQESPYYWRVKAADSAGNEGEWSVPQSFYTGSPFTMPVWATALLIALLVIVIGFLAFVVGRRTAFRSSY